jgi:hypothetical protein
MVKRKGNKLLLLLCNVLLFSFTPACTSQPAPTQPDLSYTTTPEISSAPLLGERESGSGYPGAQDVLPAYPAPSLAEGAYPAPPTAHSADGRRRTALDSYQLALEVARAEYSPDVQLYAIVPSGIMLANLGNPPVLPGWFYKFRKPDSRRDFFVQVVDEIVTGTTLAESVIDEMPLEQPIAIEQIRIDSDVVLARFMEDGGTTGIWREGITYDLELIYFQGINGPIWSVVDPFTGLWLYSVDAITGMETKSPYEQ